MTSFKPTWQLKTQTGITENNFYLWYQFVLQVRHYKILDLYLREFFPLAQRNASSIASFVNLLPESHQKEPLAQYSLIWPMKHIKYFHSLFSVCGLRFIITTRRQSLLKKTDRRLQKKRLLKKKKGERKSYIRVQTARRVWLGNEKQTEVTGATLLGANVTKNGFHACQLWNVFNQMNMVCKKKKIPNVNPLSQTDLRKSA